MARAEAFDKRYYDRFYRDSATRVTTPRQTRALAEFVVAYLKHLGLPVRRVLDAGCGLGYWRAPLLEAFPRARYEGIEVSHYLCERYGWTQASVVDYRPRGRFDLVICQGVLQYLDGRQAQAALANLGQLCRGALFVEALTREDWENNCDRDRTDGAVHLRPAQFYARRLARDFDRIGGGLFLHRQSTVTLYELEKL